jgi:MFS family permease
VRWADGHDRRVTYGGACDRGHGPARSGEPATSVMRWGLGRNATLLIAGQGVRAAGYGFTAVILGALLAARRYGPLQAGVVLTAMIAGTALASLVVGRLADRVGRRRCYAVFFLGVAVAGAVVAAGAPLWLLLIVALTGTLSTDVVDNGPATTLEQVMLAGEDAGTARAYGRYNAVGAAAGALGALAAAAPGLGRVGTGGAVNAWLFLALVPVGLTGALFASQLSSAVEARPADPDLDRSEASTAPTPTGRLDESR